MPVYFDPPISSRILTLFIYRYRAYSTWPVRQNLLFYCLTNDVVIDKSGRGVEDLRGQALRLPISDDRAAIAAERAAWAANDLAPGLKALRYVKFGVRAALAGRTLRLDPDECAFVVATLRRALDAGGGHELRGFWFGYCLDEALGTQAGVAALRAWVVEHGGSEWWAQLWRPYVLGANAATAETLGRLEAQDEAQETGHGGSFTQAPPPRGLARLMAKAPLRAASGRAPWWRRRWARAGRSRTTRMTTRHAAATDRDGESSVFV